MTSSPRAHLPLRPWLLHILVAFPLTLIAAPAKAADDALTAKAYAAWWTGSLLASNGRVIPPGHTLVEPYLLFSEPWKESATHALQSLVVAEAGLADRLDLQIVMQGSYQFKGGASSVQLGDTRVRLAFQVLEAENERWVPDLMFFVKEVIPTGRHDQLDPKLQGTDASGTGSYATAFGVNVQKVVVLPDAHPLRMRLNLNFQVPRRVTFTGPSVYGGTPGATSSVYPGKSFSTVIAAEYHLTWRWVAALDFVYAHAGSDAWVAAASAGGMPAAAGNPSQDRFTFAPAIEYNFNGDVGIIGGFSVDLGRNVTTTISPMIAVNLFH
jgi:hypothetical protein